MDIIFNFPKLHYSFTIGSGVAISVTSFIIIYIAISLHFIIKLTKGIYNRKYTLGLPFGLVIVGDLDENNALSHLNNKLVKAEKEKNKMIFAILLIYIVVMVNLKLRSSNTTNKKITTDN